MYIANAISKACLRSEIGETILNLNHEVIHTGNRGRENRNVCFAHEIRIRFQRITDGLFRWWRLVSDES